MAISLLAVGFWLWNVIIEHFMDTFRFKNFVVYKDAKRLRQNGRKLLLKFPFREEKRLVDQISRALDSVVLNIAEGSAKRTDDDFARFLSMAIASVSEAVAGFDASKDDRYVSEQEFDIFEIEAESVAKQLGKFIGVLKKNVTKSQLPHAKCHKPAVCSYAAQ